MSITSFSFALFIAAILLVYYFLSPRAQNYWLLIASYAFCISWAWTFALLLAAITLVNYVVARRLDTTRSTRRRWLGFGIGVNVFTLLVFRYAEFFVAELVALLRAWGITGVTGALEILLPLGLSFYALQAISYLIDVSRGQIQAESNFVDFALYMAYWPKLVAGPIERARTFLPQLKQPRVVDNEQLANSFTLIVVGLVRKIVIADSLASLIPPQTFQAGSRAHGAEAWLWLGVFYFFLYNDFAGYTSLVRGVSGLFGIALAPNFNAPFFARSFSEYWTRWHMTLSNWLRDYIFMPLSRALLRRNPNPRNLLNLSVPPIVTMLVCGVWHGGTANMLLWGGMHGAFLFAERIPAFWRPHIPAHKFPAWRQALAMLSVFGLTLIVLVPFIMDVPTTWSYWQRLVQFGGSFALDARVLILMAPALALDWMQYHYQDELVWLRLPRFAQAGLLAAAILVLFLILQSDSGVPFVYQGF
jgi:alginate O-acetyltransferase complex protein AlgI